MIICSRNYALRLPNCRSYQPAPQSQMEVTTGFLAHLAFWVQSLASPHLKFGECGAVDCYGLTNFQRVRVTIAISSTEKANFDRPGW